MPIAVLGGAWSIYAEAGGFTIPKRGSTTHPVLEEIWTETDHQINDMGHLGEGVTRGCKVSALDSPSRAITVGAGSVKVRGSTLTVASMIVLIPQGDPTFDRIDVIAAYRLTAGIGQPTVVAGTPNLVPYPPALPSGYVGLAFVFVGANVTAIAEGDLIDKRIFLV